MSNRVPDKPFQLNASDLEKYVFNGGVNPIFLLMLNTGNTDIWAANWQRSADLVVYEMAADRDMHAREFVAQVGFVTRGVARLEDLQLALYEGSSLKKFGYAIDINTKDRMFQVLGPMVPNGGKIVWEHQY